MTGDEPDSRGSFLGNGAGSCAGIAKTEGEVPHGTVNVDSKIVRNHQPATDFVDDAAHDLHTPLNVIIGMCRLLDRDPEPLTPRQKDAVRRIERNGQALLKSINDLLRHLRSRRDH